MRSVAERRRAPRDRLEAKDGKQKNFNQVGKPVYNYFRRLEILKFAEHFPLERTSKNAAHAQLSRLTFIKIQPVFPVRRISTCSSGVKSGVEP